MRNQVRTELYLGETLGWVDVTGDARQAVADSGGGTTITRAAREPGRMDLVLANPGGRYSPRNPTSPYYGVLGRNTPIRVGLVELVDAFDRTLSSSWGTGWHSFGGGGSVLTTDWTVSGGQAQHSVPAANAYRATDYNAATWRDCEVRVTVDMAISDVLGGTIEPANIILRWQSTSDYYLARVEVPTSENVWVSLHHSSAGIIAGAVQAPITFTGQPLRVAAACVGDRLAVKVWDPAAGGEPRDWQVTATDRQITTAGGIGIRSGVASGNSNTKPILFAYDDLEVIDRRAVMEVASWPPRWNVPGTDTWVPIEAAGIMRRLGQGAKPLDSALYRALTRAAPSAYWPLEDPAGSLSARSAVDGVGPMTTFGYSRFTTPGTGTPVEAAGLPVFGSGGGIPGSGPVLDLAQGGVLRGLLPAKSGDDWRIEFVMVAPRDKAAARIPIRWKTSGTWDTWEFQIESTGLFSTLGTGLTALGSATATFNVFDGLPHHYSVQALQSGGAVYADIHVDGVYVGQYNTFISGMVGNAGRITEVIVNPLEEVNGTESMPVIGHVVVWNPYVNLGINTVEAAHGHAGETAADRIERLCAEEGVPVGVSYGPDDSAAMGPQLQATFLDLLRECEDVDGGILAEAREQLALTYRALGTLYNQDPVTLDYTHLAPPLEPTDDDQQVRNDVTVSRPDGGTARAVLEAGPLSVQPPPDGVGTYNTSLTLNVADDAQLPDQAGWRLHVGTWDEARYPRARVNLAAPVWEADPAATRQIVAAAEGDAVELDGLPAWLPPGPVPQLVRGSVEYVDEFERVVDWTLTPAGPWTVAQADGDARPAGDGTTLTAGITSSATSLQLTAGPQGTWTTDPVDFPLDIVVGGEVIRLSAISGSSSPQTATVAARSVNGIVKSHGAGAAVDVYTPAIVPL